MALTRDEIKARLAARLAPQYRDLLTWAQLVAAVGAAGSGKKQEVLNAVKAGNARQVGDLLISLTGAYLKTLADADADAMIADDTLSLAELEKVL